MADLYSALRHFFKKKEASFPCIKYENTISKMGGGMSAMQIWKDSKYGFQKKMWRGGRGKAI